MKFSLSRFSFISVLFFLLGIGIGTFIPVPFFVYIPFVILTFIFLYFKKGVKKQWFILGGIFLLGIAWYQFSFPKLTNDHICSYNNKQVSFQARVVKEKDQRIDKEKLILGDIKIGNKDIQGKVLINVGLYSQYKYGDILKINGYLKKPQKFKEFNYKMYLARYGVYSICYYPDIKKIGEKKYFFYKNILKFKHKIRYLIDNKLPESQSTILQALILGYKKEIPSYLREKFARAGVSHILAISGLHIAILISILSIIFTSFFGLKPKLNFWVIFIFILFFVILTGLPASAIRAALMGLLLIIAKRIDRPVNGLRLLIFVAFFMLFLNPKLLGWDIGFQFSFLAVLGIYFLTPIFKKVFKKIPNFKFLPIRSYLAVSLGAQIMVLPLIIYYFGNLSLIAPIANVLVLSIIPIVMIAGFIFVIFSLAFYSLSSLLSLPVFFLLTYILLIVELLQVPYLSFIFRSFPLFLVLIMYLIIILFICKKNDYFNKKDI